MLEYIIFLLGADSFNLSIHIRKNENRYGMDEIYEFCKKVAKDFLKSEFNKNLSVSQYEALEGFLFEKTDFYVEMFNKKNGRCEK